jgi:hypothetical protein
MCNLIEFCLIMHWFVNYTLSTTTTNAKEIHHIGEITTVWVVHTIFYT